MIAALHIVALAVVGVCIGVEYGPLMGAASVAAAWLIMPGARE